MRGTPPNFRNISLLAALQLDKMTGRDGLFCDHVEAGKEISQGVLQRKCDCQRADAERRDKRCYRNPYAVKKDEYAQADDHTSRDALDQAERSFHSRGHEGQLG